MAPGKKPKLCGLAEPYLMREPAFIRLCSAFVENLAMILRVALVVGAIFLVRDLREFTEQPGPAAIEAKPIVAESESEPAAPKRNEDRVLTPGVVHAMKCTFEEYRNEHFDECVAESSEIYARPEADPDDTGFVQYQIDTLYASTTDRRLPR